MITRRIREDHAEYIDLVKDQVRSKLKEYITHGQRPERRGDNTVVVNVPYIDLPSFRFGHVEDGIGSGPVSQGDTVGDGPLEDEAESDGPGHGGEGHRGIGVGVDMETYLDMLGDEFELPHLVPKQNGEMTTEEIKWNRIARQGNNSLVHKKRTFKNALKRHIGTGTYDYKDPSNVYPIREDKRYKSWNPVDLPDTNAVIFFMCDISGSMTGQKREIIKNACWYLESWIARFYDNVHIKYIVHDTYAEEVDQEKFYGYNTGGGTLISSAFELCERTIRVAYPVDKWNIYVFYMSDGENHDSDNKVVTDYITQLEPVCNAIGIADVQPSAWGTFVPYLKSEMDDGVFNTRKTKLSTMRSNSDIINTIKTFLSKDSIVHSSKRDAVKVPKI